MINIILHIGKHKTGTTALQDYLYDNKKDLLNNGFYYLDGYKRETAHHQLSEYLFSDEFLSLNENEKDIELNKIYSTILEEIEQYGKNKTIIISSEGFQNVTPRFLKKIFKEDIFNVLVVSYFREQVGYTASSYNQEIHARIVDLNLDTFIKSFNADYMKFIESWDRNFSNVVLRIFNKNILYKQDVIDDFFKNILKINLLNEKKKSSNPSLSQRYLAFKLKYNQKAIADELPHLFDPGKLYTLLGNFSKEECEIKFMLSCEQRKYLINKYQDSNKLFLEKYFDGYKFDYQKCDNEKSLLDMSEKEFWKIYEKIDLHKWPL